jgi:hypothetical protein
MSELREAAKDARQLELLVDSQKMKTFGVSSKAQRARESLEDCRKCMDALSSFSEHFSVVLSVCKDWLVGYDEFREAGHIQSITGNTVTFHKGGPVTFGNGQRFLDDAKRLNLPVMYLEGVRDGAGFRYESEKDKIEQAYHELWRSKAAINAACYHGKKLTAVLDFLRNGIKLDEYAAESVHEAAKHHELINYKQAIKDKVHFSRIVRESCSAAKMPEPPPAMCRSSAVHEQKRFSGIYFGWRNGICFYVGKSVNIPSRLKSHDKIQHDDDVSYLRFDEKDIHHHELFYIWLMKPIENNETKQATKTALAESN